MLFNSIDFAVFLPVVFLLYWILIGNLRLQNILIVISSYTFYGWWDWRFLSLIFVSTLLDYSVSRRIQREDNEQKRKALLWFSLAGNLGLLGFFKYYNFFVENFVDAFSFFGREFELTSLNIVLPVGISFYTFQTLSYTIDVYRRKLTATSDFVAFSAFVSFFPQLVAGPIERATNLLPQFYTKRAFNYDLAVDGVKQMGWGLFKKVVIADNCAEIVNIIFATPGEYSGSTLALGAFLFAFQIYGDFSGYSDIAIGCARLFGFTLMQNFAFPYFSRDIAEFWRRWHISLTTWFRDYVYIPLGGSHGTIARKIRNTVVVFLLSGFWHGANWTFIVWGLLNALYFLPLLVTGSNRNNIGPISPGRSLPAPRELIMMLGTFSLTVFAWIFFRAESIGHAISYIDGLLSPSLFSIPAFLGMGKALAVLVLIGFLISVEWYGRHEQYAIARVGRAWSRPVRWVWYCFLIFLIGMFMQTQETPFIYFQF